MNGVLKDFGLFCASPSEPPMKIYREREIEDRGSFGVFWYRRPTGHTKTGARHRGESPWVTEWAFVIKAGDVWQSSAAVAGFATKEAAEIAAEQSSSSSQ